MLAAITAMAATACGGPPPARASALPRFGPATPFDFGALTARAEALAARPYRPATIAAPDRVEALTYAEHWRIRYRDAANLYPAGRDAPVQLFHPARFFPEPVAIHAVEDGRAREIRFDPGYFAIPSDSPARGLPAETGFAGFRVMRPDLETDWVSFLGASYFRTDGPGRQYGLSARGIAVDTALDTGEEFPRFTAFWLGGAERAGETMTVWALLDGPSIAGAYRFGLVQGADGSHRTDVEARLFPRATVGRLGIAPLTSMYWYAERDRRGADDWRPEIHDSDGLAIHTGAGERLWRALRNPGRVTVSSFLDENPKGFGLIQRDRAFANYQDDGIWYDRRPSAWVEPAGGWGRGAVQLVEIPTVDETFDNIVAYWTPEATPPAGSRLDLAYAIHWLHRDPRPGEMAEVVATWHGRGGVPGDPVPAGVDKMVVDFDGPAIQGLALGDGLRPVVEMTGGEVVGEVALRPIVGTPRWRLSFDFRPTGVEPADMRAHLVRAGQRVSETWMTQAGIERSL
ncbi:MAG: glucan biosynthesis protein D [Pseudomonadota bacterium]